MSIFDVVQSQNYGITLSLMAESQILYHVILCTIYLSLLSLISTRDHMVQYHTGIFEPAAHHLLKVHLFLHSLVAVLPANRKNGVFWLGRLRLVFFLHGERVLFELVER